MSTSRDAPRRARRAPAPTRREELAHARERYEALVQAVDGIVWEADADTLQFTFVSDAAERILGYPTRAWLDDRDFWVRNIHPDDRDAAVAYCRAETRQKRNHTFEYRMLAADGRTVWLRDYVRYVHAPDDAPVLRGIMIDITGEKQAATALRSSCLLYTSPSPRDRG
jgi:PAS domain S-box-containing protein